MLKLLILRLQSEWTEMGNQKKKRKEADKEVTTKTKDTKYNNNETKFTI